MVEFLLVEINRETPKQPDLQSDSARLAAKMNT